MNPFAIIATIILCLFTLALPRRYAVIPLIVSATYMTLGQQIVLVNLHFTIMRIIILFAWLRVFFRHEFTLFRWITLDKLIVCYVIVGVITGVLLEKSMDGFINRLGFAYNVIGIYFFCRAVLRDYEDIDYILSAVAILVLPLAATMVIEKSTGRNLFAVFGGVPEFTYIREGRLRCQGPFGHPILAGTFGATLMPLMVGRWIRHKRSRVSSILGLVGVTIITLTSASSGPVMAYLFGIIGLLIWPLRNRMRTVRWAIALGTIFLHLIMKAPVWFIIERISGIIGGGGYHRSELIDQAIKNFNDWWLVGTVYTAHWLPYYLPVSPGYVDITNEFIAQGVTGGVLKLVLFIWIIALAFKKIGNGIHNQELRSKPQSLLKGKLSKRFNALFKPRNLTIQNRKTSSLQMDNRMSGETLIPFLPESQYGIRLLYWSLGVSLLTHIVSFISVSYFDQMIVFFYLLLSMIGVASATEDQANKESLKTSKTIPTRRLFSKKHRATGHPVLSNSRK